MKKIITAFYIALFASSSASADWASDWLEDSMVNHSGPSYFEGSARNYFTAGNLSHRTRVDEPGNLVTLSMPRLNTGGCGGYDLFYGGFSYLDLDMLVEKFEQMLQNSGAIAFQIGLKALSEKLATSLEGMEKIINEINSVQLDSCQESKRIVQKVMDVTALDSFPMLANAQREVIGTIASEQELEQGTSRNATDFKEKVAQENNQPSADIDISSKVSGCPTAVREALTLDGSVVNYIANRSGMGTYSDTIRGFLGDLLVVHSSVGKVPEAIAIPACAANIDVMDFAYGLTTVRPLPTVDTNLPACEPAETNLFDVIDTHLSNLIDSLTNGKKISEYDGLEAFMNTAPFEVYGVMQFGVESELQNHVKSEITEMLAYSYTKVMIANLFENTTQMMDLFKKSVNNYGYQGDPAQSGTCDISAYSHIVQAYSSYSQSVQRQQKKLHARYEQEMQNLQSKVSILQYYYDRKESIGLSNMKGK